MRISDWSSDVCSSDLGTLYGANSLGGLVRIVSRRPQLDEFSGLATAEGTSVDGGGQGYAFRGALNVPIVRDQLAIRSEEHTSELQSLMRNSYAVFCLQKKNKPRQLYTQYIQPHKLHHKP